MRKSSKILAALAVALPLATGCAGTDTRTEPASGSAADVDYHLFVAELALQRQDYTTAVEEYQRAAQLSLQSDVARRATLLADQFGYRDIKLATAKRWVDLDPESLDARGYLAAALVDGGQAKQAVPHLKVLLRSAESIDTGYIHVLALLLNRDDEATATSAMRSLAKVHPRSPEGHYAVAMLALRSDELGLARDQAHTATELAPDWVPGRLAYARVLIASGEVDEGLEQAASVIDETTDPSSRLDYAMLLASTNHVAEARTELEIVLEERPALPGALRTLGVIEYQSGNLEPARRRFNELLMTGRMTDDAFFYLAAIAEIEQDFRRAMRLYSRVGPGPNLLPAQIRTSRLLYELGEEDASLTQLERFGTTFPDYEVDALIARATLLVDMGRPDDAVSLYSYGIERHPDSDSLLYGRAFLYERLDRVDDAVTELRQILRQKPGDATALNALGYTLADRTTRYREAERHIRAALTIEPDNAAIIDSMGWVLYRRERYEEALVYLQRAYELAPDPEIAAHLGELLWAMGREQQAQLLLESALAENPDSTALIETWQRIGE